MECPAGNNETTAGGIDARTPGFRALRFSTFPLDNVQSLYLLRDHSVLLCLMLQVCTVMTETMHTVSILVDIVFPQLPHPCVLDKKQSNRRDKYIPVAAPRCLGLPELTGSYSRSYLSLSIHTCLYHSYSTCLCPYSHLLHCPHRRLYYASTDSRTKEFAFIAVSHARRHEISHRINTYQNVASLPSANHDV